MKVTFIKTLAYDPTFGGQHSLYDGYRLSALQKTDPPLRSADISKQIHPYSHVYVSDFLRTKQTAGQSH